MAKDDVFRLVVSYRVKRDPSGKAEDTDLVFNVIKPILEKALLETVTEAFNETPAKTPGFKKNKTIEDYRTLVEEGTEFTGGRMRKIAGGIPSASARLRERGSATFAGGIVVLQVHNNYWGKVFQMQDRGTAPTFGRYVPTGKSSPSGKNQVGFRDTKLDVRKGSPSRAEAVIREDVRRRLGGKTGGDPLLAHLKEKRLGQATRGGKRKGPKFQSQADKILAASRKRNKALKPRKTEFVFLKGDKFLHPGYNPKNYTRKFYNKHIIASFSGSKTPVTKALLENMSIHKSELLALYGVQISEYVLNSVALVLFAELNAEFFGKPDWYRTGIHG